MALCKLEVEKFDGHNDFRMWQKKMKAVLVQHRCSKALVEELNNGKDKKESSTDQESQEMNELAYSLLILNLADNVLR